MYQKNSKHIQELDLFSLPSSVFTENEPFSVQIMVFTTLKKSHYIKGNTVGKGDIVSCPTMLFSKLMLFSEISILFTCCLHHLSFWVSPFHTEIYTSMFFISSAT